MAKPNSYHFSGYATKNNLLCADGRRIRRNAFKECDGKTVPLVWNHGGRSDPSEVLGHALLENREDGVYMYGTFNNSEKAQIARECVKNGDITGLSIYANSLKQKAGDVLHGVIREVSLVLSGANPGAMIDFVMQHDSDSLESFYYYLNGDEYCELQHSDDMDDEEDEYKDEYEDEEDDEEEDAENLEHATPELTKKDREAGNEILDVLNTLSEKQKAAVVVLIDAITKKAGGSSDDEDDKEKAPKAEKELKHAKPQEDDEDDDEEGESAEDILKTLNDKQKAAVAMMIEAALEEENDKEDKKDEEDDMKHNAYEDGVQTNGDIRGLLQASIADIDRFGTLKKSILAHAADFGYDDEDALAHAYPKDANNNDVTYGVYNVADLMPDARSIDATPRFIQRNVEWVDVFLNGAHKSPFSRVKTIFADITADEARAKGYTKGNRKVEEVFVLLKRVTEPTTIYKKQKLDHQDIKDITDFNVVTWMRAELEIMWNEEKARAALIGDGRSNAPPDKISELNIRPIYTDDSLFSIKADVVVPSDHTEEDDAKAFIRHSIKARKDYKGSGNPVLFTTPDMLTSMLLLEDSIGRSLYATEAELAAKLRVKKIVEVPVMENLTRTSGAKTLTLAGIIVNPYDYNFGSDHNGEKEFFQDFDIDYNQEKYLLESRCSGALVAPYSAIVLEIDPSGAAAHTA